MAIVLDIWKVPKAVSFPSGDVTVVGLITGPGGVLVSAGVVSPVFVTADHIQTENATLGVVGSLEVLGSLNPDQDLSALFTKTTEPDGTIGYISYQAELDAILAKYPDGTVIKSIPTGKDASGNTVVGGGNPPYFQQITVVALGDPQYGKLFQYSVATVLNDSNPTGTITFIIGLAASSHIVHDNTVTMNAYDKPVKIKPNDDGTVKVTVTATDGTDVETSPKWTFSQSQPDASDKPQTINLTITKNGVS